ncbi:Serine/threonine-protein kinase PknB [Minicystis rosea]|nr:Serine/threonine-protein kinase PknB [Minicystis rosea]
MNGTGNERNGSFADASAPDDEPAVYDTDQTYQRDLRSLVAQAYAELPPLPARDEEIVEVPPSVRAAIRLTDSLIPIVPPDEPPPAPVVTPAARMASRGAMVGGVVLLTLGFVALARFAPTAPPPPAEVARAVDALGLPPPVETAAPAPRAPEAKPEPATTPQVEPSSKPIRMRKAQPPAKAQPQAPASPPPLMDAITDAVRRRSGEASAPRR